MIFIYSQLSENIWLYMTRELLKSAVDIATKNDLLREIQSMWRNIELDYIRNLYQSTLNRLDSVILKNEGSSH